MRVYRRLVLVLLVLGWLPAIVHAEQLDADLLAVQQEWARANYQLNGDAQIKAYEKLIIQCELLNKKYAESAELLAWNGIVESSYAGAKGGLGAMKHAKKARKLFEQSIQINPQALDGSAYTSLGVLYYKVPGFPIGFGSRKKASEYLHKALEINPDGIDTNYFYADFLMEQGKYQDSIPVLEKALAAPSRVNRPNADAGRREEIKSALANARAAAK